MVKYMVVQIGKNIYSKNTGVSHASFFESCYIPFEKGFNDVQSGIEFIKTLEYPNNFIVIQYWV